MNNLSSCSLTVVRTPECAYAHFDQALFYRGGISAQRLAQSIKGD